MKRALAPLLLLLATPASAREPLRDLSLVHDVVRAFVESIDVDDPAVLAARFPERSFVDFDRDGDGAFGAALGEAARDARLAILQFDHDDHDFDGDGLPGRVELDCRIDGEWLDPTAARTFAGVLDADLDCDGDGVANGVEVAAGRDPNDASDDALCPGEASEPNDAPADAAPLLLQDRVATRDDSTLCGADEDWFEVQVPGGTLRVDVVGAGERLAFELHPPAGAPIAVDGARGEVADAAVGVWRVRVLGRNARYGLAVSVSGPGECAPDPGETPPDDDEAGRARAVELPGLAAIERAEANICAGDVDWYAVDLFTGDRLTARLEHPVGAELEMAVFGPGVDASEPDVVGQDFAERTLVSRAGRHTVRVRGARADVDGDYALELGVQRDRLPCVADALEPNDAQGRAVDLMARPGFAGVDEDGAFLVADANRVVSALSLCGGDEDWFALDLRAGDDLALALDRPQGATELTVELRAANGAVLARGRGRGAEVATAAFAVDGGRYFVRVRGGEALDYALRLRRTAGQICAPDPFEVGGGNDRRATAAALEPGTLEALTLCGEDDDEDWFEFELAQRSDVVLDLDFAHADADLDLEVFADGEPIALNDGEPQGHSRNDGERVRLLALPPGRYQARVFGVAGGDAEYGLALEVTEEQFDCVDDPDEPNDGFAQATLLGGGAHDGRDTQWLCFRVPDEADTFRVEVPPGEARTLGVTFIFGDDGDAALEVFDDGEMMRAATANLRRGPSKQCVTIAPAAAQRVFYLRVVPLFINTFIDDEQLDYELFVLEGADCERFGPRTRNVDWPEVD